MTSYRDAFVEAFSDIAFDVAKTTGISAQVVLGQAALESGWGRHAPGNNLHGIKGQGQTLATKEDYGKGKVSVNQSFKTFDNPDESFTHWGGMMNRMDRYGPVRNAATVKDEIASMAKSGYATAKDYKSSLTAAVNAVQSNKAFQDRAVEYATSQFDPAEVNLDGVLKDEGYRTHYDGSINPVPSGRVEVSDLAPLGAPSGFDPSQAGISGEYGEEQAWGGYTPDYAAQPDYSDISAGMYGAPAYPGSSLESFTPNEAATPDFSGAMPQSNFDAIQSEAFPGASFNMEAYAPDPGLSINPVGAAGFGEYAGVSPTDYQGGFHAGLDETTPTPDFNAPSLDQRQQDMISQERVSNFEQGNWARPGSIPQDVINADIMNELAPAPTQVASLGPVAAAPREAVSAPPSTVEERPFDMQGAYLADLEDKLGPRALPAPSVQPVTDLPALPVTSVDPVRAAPITRDPVRAAPVSAPAVRPAPTLPTATLPQSSFPQSAPTPPERPSGSYQGFGTINDALGAIGAGVASMPSGYNEAWGKTAFGDSVYAGPAYNDLMDAVSKQAGFEDRKSVIGDMPASVKGGALGMIGGPLGMVAGAAFGGLKDAGYNLNPFSGLGSFFGDVFGQGSNDSSFGGYSIGDVTSPDGYAGIGAGIDNFMDSYSPGGPSGGSQSGGGGFGGYGNADGSVSNDGPGIW